MCSSLKLWRAMVRVHAATFSSSPPPPLPQGLVGPVGAKKPADDGPMTIARRLQGSDGKREVFTIWMKSLVLHGSGCTVYDSAGSIVYRVDNYGARSAADVCLMDLTGNVVLQILRKKLGFGRRWDGYRCEQERRPTAAARRPWLKVVRAWAWRGPSSSTCELIKGDTTTTTAVRYTMDDGRISLARAARIVDGATGLAVAEVKRKTTPAGIALGADVLTLAVDPSVDRAIIMALVLVHGLINRAM